MERGPAREAAPASQSAQTSASQSSAVDSGARARKSPDKAAAPAGIEFPRHFTLPDASATPRRIAGIKRVRRKLRISVADKSYGQLVKVT